MRRIRKKKQNKMVDLNSYMAASRFFSEQKEEDAAFE